MAGEAIYDTSDTGNTAGQCLGYRTDGFRLYEIRGEESVRNYGLSGGVIKNTLLEDCESGATCWVDGLTMLALTEIVPNGK